MIERSVMPCSFCGMAPVASVEGPAVRICLPCARRAVDLLTAQTPAQTHSDPDECVCFKRDERVESPPDLEYTCPPQWARDPAPQAVSPRVSTLKCFACGWCEPADVGPASRACPMCGATIWLESLATGTA